MTDQTNAREYWNAVDGIVSELVSDAARDLGDEFNDASRLLDAASDRVFEYVDGNWWLIYTHAARAVLLHSSNEDAIFEEGMELGDVQTMSDVYTKAAFYAMCADIRDRLEDAVDEYIVANVGDDSDPDFDPEPCERD